ncbi:MAG: flippase-like domain-containing protein, partial [Deltaproteobacteria bacterium]|nr:flippase-like domain-containing protein [Deltaproteobacteria bacterium]
MSTSIRRSVERYWLIFFFISLGLFMLIFKISPLRLANTIRVLQFWQIIVILSFYTLISTLQILSRGYLFRLLGSKSSWKNIILIHFSSMAAHYSSPAKLGFPLSVFLFNKLDGIPYPIGTAMVTTELFVSTGICGIFAFVGSLFFFSIRGTLLLLGLVIGGSGLAFLGILMAKANTHEGKVWAFFKEMKHAFSNVSPRSAILYCLFRALIQITSGISFAVLAHFFLYNLKIWEAVIVTSSAFFIGAISFIPMGLGVREGSVLFYLGYLGVPGNISLSIVTVNRLI